MFDETNMINDVTERVMKRLLEGAFNFSDAIGSNWSLFETNRLGETLLILYRSRDVIEAFRHIVSTIQTNDFGDLKDVLAPYVDASIIGAISVNIDNAVPEVDEIVSRVKGVGPLLYDIAIILHGSLSPSRGLVSKSAQSVWEKYATRHDVITKTYVPNDLEEPDRSDTLNVIVKHKNPNRQGVKSLKSNHANLIDIITFECRSKHRITGDVGKTLEDILIRCASDMLRVGAR